MKQELSVALVQMTSIDDIESNALQIEQALDKIQASAFLPSLKPRLICFPENCLYLRTKEGEVIQPIPLDHPVILRLAIRAKTMNSFLHLGSLPTQVEGQLFNSAVLIDDQGQIRSTYQKIHLFDIQLSGQKAIRESDVFRHGEKPHIFEIDGWRFGETICYDLRFAELFSRYAREEVDAILVPSAFLVTTGEAHWEVMLRARAIESQTYILAAAQGGRHIGKHGGVRETFGDSLVVEPWGKVVSRAESSPAIVLATLSREHVENVRRQIPMKSHRRSQLGN